MEKERLTCCIMVMRNTLIPSVKLYQHHIILNTRIKFSLHIRIKFIVFYRISTLNNAMCFNHSHITKVNSRSQLFCGNSREPAYFYHNYHLWINVSNNVHSCLVCFMKSGRFAWNLKYAPCVSSLSRLLKSLLLSRRTRSRAAQVPTYECPR